MKIVLWLTICWLPLLMAYMLNNETKFKKNIVLGVTFPAEAREDPVIVKEIRDFRRNLVIVCAVLILLAVVFFLVSGKTTMMTYWGIWLTLAIVLPYLPYLYANIRLKEIKQEKGWSGNTQTVTVDTAAVSVPGQISGIWYVIPAVICLVPAFFDKDLIWPSVLFSLMCLLMWFSSRRLYRNKAEIVDGNTDLTNVLSRIRRYNWEKLWVLSCWFMAACSLLMGLAVYAPLPATVLTFVLLAGFTVYVFRLEMKTRTMQERLTAGSGKEWYTDDDDYWPGGLIYYNPNDSRLIINNRIGLNSTVNTARPAGKILMFASALVLVLLPFFGVFMDRLGMQEITLRHENGVIQAEAGITKYTLNENEIISAELRDTLPSGLVKLAGTGMDTLLKGSFKSEETGKVTVLADPETPPFILIRTENETFLLGCRDASLTKEIYRELK